MTNNAHAKIEPLPIETAPKDGTILRLLVDYTDEGENPLEDEEQAWTIGFNQLSDTGKDVWEFAGWSWEQDCFTTGVGKPVGWLPFHVAHIPDALESAPGVVEIDLRAVMMESIEEAASQSPWVPPEYTMNEVVSDCCAFLLAPRGDQSEMAAMAETHE